MEKNEIKVILSWGTKSKLYGILMLLLFSFQVGYSIKDENDFEKSFNLNVVQQRTVTGKVTDPQAKPVPGVTVHIKNTSIGTITDSNGDYSLINFPENATLVFSFVGMKTIEVQMNGQSVINVTLTEETIGLDEVIAIGYGTMKKSDVTGSVLQVGGDELKAVPVYRTEQALRGLASGVQVKQNSGNPTAGIQVRIRGSNSLQGSNNPLYVVDGIPLYGGIEYLTPSDIESINILKDASATAIYGSRGANGVILVTTRQGRKGEKGTISFDSYYGWQDVLKRYDVLNAQQYATLVNEWLTNNGQTPYFTGQNVTMDTDWQDVVFRTAPIQNHTLTFTGGGEKTSYNISGDFYSQDGIIRNSSVKKGTFKIGLRSEVNSRMTVDGNVILSRRETYDVSVDNGAYGKTTLSGALSAPPTLPVYDENGVPTQIETAYTFGSVDMRNPAIFLEPRKSRRLMDKILANSSLSIKIIDGLVFKTLAGIEYFYGINDNFTPMIYPADKGSASDGYNYENSVVSENTLSYKKTFNNKHSFDVVGGFTYQDYTARSESASVSGLASNITENFNLASGEIINTPGNSWSEWTLLSWLGRVNYSLSGKYLFTASIRADGSSRFGANNKWGYFPSAAVAWRISEEEFMKSVRPVSHLKLRASYGVTGSTALSPYQSLSRLGSTKYIVSNATQEVGWYPTGIGNADLTWETTTQTDAGLDLGLFNNRLNLSFDFYYKLTDNLLASVPLPPSVGFSSTLDNLGKVSNKGLELSLNASVIDQQDLKWNVTANISGNRNKVKEISRGSDIESGTLDIPFYSATNIIRQGLPMGMFYGYQEDGLDENGLIKYRDNVIDGAINALDRVIIGNPYPDFIWSISSDLTWRNWDMNLFIDASQGNDLFWATAGTHLNSFARGHNQFTDIIGNYWTPENPDPKAKYPVLSNQTSVTVSDRFIEDGSYIRLRNVSLGYSLPVRRWGMEWCSRARFYVTAVNYLTITKYPGVDPEQNTVGSDIQGGIDQGGYPSAKSILVGVNLSF